MQVFQWMKKPNKLSQAPPAQLDIPARPDIRKGWYMGCSSSFWLQL